MMISALPSNVFAETPLKTVDDSILDNTPIDVVYKYIDLTDPNLHRDGIKQIKKDYDNEELRYSLRSVLQNIPWVRKIFIIMPNEKVRFLKEPDEISDKIVYVNDKDLIGFDSASIITFEFNLWRLKDFGCSENFIYFNDDYFVGKPMKKSDFFYVENNQVVPYVLFNNPVAYGQYEKIKSFGNQMEQDMNKDKHNTHSAKCFQYQKTSSLMFLYEVFKRDILMPCDKLTYFPHNAMAENLSENKEVYDVVKNNYEHQKSCLEAIYRERNSLVGPQVYNFYVLNKYNRKINKVPSAYIDLSETKNRSFNYKLFCINTGGSRDYTEQEYSDAKLTMMNLFPHKTKYEKPDLPIHIAMGLDNNYVYPTLVAMTSVLENANPDTKYDFHLMVPGEFTDKNKQIIKSLESKYKRCSINIINMKDAFKSAKSDSKITTPTYYRLMLPSLLPNVDKIIWLDGDTLTFGDLTEMRNLDMENYYFRGFLDNNINGASSFGIDSDNYICAGVSLINLKALRDNNMQECFLKFIEENNDRLVQHDQTVINVLCHNKIGVLPPKFGIWNYRNEKAAIGDCRRLKEKFRYNEMEFMEAYKAPMIVHYVIGKPWLQKGNLYFMHKWWEYAKKTDYFKEIQQKYVRDKVKT